MLARKWRPQTFEEVISQDHITATLTNAIKGNRIAHAYIFSGTRGIGKTTMARIFAKALNCENGPTPFPCNRCSTCKEITDGTSVDIIEIDGASNTGVDDIRELREQVKYLPMKGKFKAFIIDEVHMLSTSAFNALLKTLEEPPPHVIFVFATTEVHKIPSTIISRCQHFNFKRIPRQEIMKRLQDITQKEGIKISERSSGIIAKMADGSMRDSLSILDQVISYCGNEVKEDDMYLILGIVDRGIFTEVTDAISKKDSREILILAKRLIDSGYDIRQFCGEVVEHFRNLLVAKVSKRCEDLLELSRDDIDEIVRDADKFSLDELERLVTLFSRTQDEIRISSNSNITFEMALIRATQIRTLQPIEMIMERLGRIEAEITKGEGKGGFSEEEKDNREIGGGKEGDNETPVIESDDTNKVEDDSFATDWKGIVKTVKDNKPSIGSCIEQGMLIKTDNDMIILGFDSKSVFAMEFIKKDENKKYISSLIEKKTGKKYGLKIVAISDSEYKKNAVESEVTQEGCSGRLKEKEERKKMFEDVLSNTIIKDTIDIFDGELIEVVPQSTTSVLSPLKSAN